MYYVEGVIFFLMFTLYLTLLRKQKKPPPGDIKKFINDTRKICLECVKRKPKRSYHCDICKVCIEQYDHHCTWINNCVGKHNIARFILFILFLVICMAIVGCFSGWALWCLFIGKTS